MYSCIRILDGDCVHTTKITPSSLENVHFKVCWSALYGGLLAVDWVSFAPAMAPFSSMKTSLIKLLMMDALIGAYVRDQRTTPEVVKISNVSNMLGGEGGFG